MDLELGVGGSGKGGGAGSPALNKLLAVLGFETDSECSCCAAF